MDGLKAVPFKDLSDVVSRKFHASIRELLNRRSLHCAPPDFLSKLVA
jgi:hypothetical protein